MQAQQIDAQPANAFALVAEEQTRKMMQISPTIDQEKVDQALKEVSDELGMKAQKFREAHDKLDEGEILCADVEHLYGVIFFGYA